MEQRPHVPDSPDRAGLIDPGTAPAARNCGRTVRRLVLAAASVALGLLLVEALLALAGIMSPNPHLYPGDLPSDPAAHNDAAVGWTMRPGHVEKLGWPGRGGATYAANGQGFRSPHDFGRKGDRRRVVFLGDSFAFGFGVEFEDSFPARLEARWGGVECMNLAQNGYCVDQMQQSLHHYGLPLGPDLVVLTFVIEDFDRSLTAIRGRGSLGWSEKPTFLVEDGRLRPMTGDDRPCWPLRFVERHSRVVETWRRAERRVSMTWRLGDRWTVNLALLAAAAEECRRAGGPFVVVYVPERDVWTPLRPLAPAMQEMGVPLLDLARRLPADRTSLHFEDDRHLNARGHAFVADQLGRFIEERGLVPRTQ
jgi:hypothetical protein